MLKEIQCDRFISNGEIRPAIKFNRGLNTILGGTHANNSIGKTTFLLIVDFVFGGNTYLENDAIRKIGPHTINFAFEFNNKIYYFSRNTTSSDEVNICDENYKVVNKVPLDKFHKILQDLYDFNLFESKFRNLLGRYFRIYGKNNHNEKKPLHGHVNEKNAEAILSLEKLFESYEVIKDYKDNAKSVTDRLNALKTTRAYDFLPYGTIKTKREFQSNEKKIKEMEEKLITLTTSDNDQYFELDLEEAEKAGFIKGELSKLTRKRARLISQLNVVNANMESDNPLKSHSYDELLQFFPEAELRKLSEIEKFHIGIQHILHKEYQQEASRLSLLIDAINSEIEHLKKELDKQGIPASLSTSYLKKYTEIQKNLESYTDQNNNFNFLNELKGSQNSARMNLKEIEQLQLRSIESTINEQMVRFNDLIYETKRKAPVLDLDGGTTYDFYTPDDSGTGTSYKSLIIFDLSVLMHSKLPGIAHDSLLFKNIGDEPINQIMKLYMTFDKQIFIAFDKDNSYSEETHIILNNSAVIRLDENGNELFGRSWNIKD